MYMTLSWQVSSGSGPKADVERDVMATLPANRATCNLVDNVLIVRAKAGNEVGEYWNLLDALGQVLQKYPNQLRFALQLTDDHYLEGFGYDDQLADQITG